MSVLTSTRSSHSSADAADTGVADLGPKTQKTLNGARRQFAEIYAAPLALNTYLTIGIVIAILFAGGLLALVFRMQNRLANAKPLVIRIDDVGRAQAISYDAAAAFRLQDREARHFLTRFVILHYTRLRATLQRDYPDSLYFLSDRVPETGGASLLQVTMGEQERSRFVQRYLTDPTLEEVDVEVKNVTLPDLAGPIYRASVDFERRYYAPGSRVPLRTETWVAQVQFRLRENVPNTFVPVNPLGFEIESLRADQAFH
jgi:hypothetical protein